MKEANVMDQLACHLGVHSEEPNIALAVLLCETKDASAIGKIVEGLHSKDTAVANDCIKVLYEIGYRNPALVAEYAEHFLRLLYSRNNRLIWGGMIALAQIAPLNPDVIFDRREQVIQAYRDGSVITRDASIIVFAALSHASPAYEAEIFPILLEHLRTCRPKEVAQHAESTAVCINPANASAFFDVLEKRRDTLTPPQLKRVDTLIRKSRRKNQ
jgi:hypothetical protein